jgi:hypothetical protein
MKNSKFLKINGEDIKKAIVLGAGVLASGEALTPIADSITDTGMPQDGHTNSIIYAVVTMVVYLLKNWFTNAKGDLLKKDIQG